MAEVIFPFSGRDSRLDDKSASSSSSSYNRPTKKARSDGGHADDDDDDDDDNDDNDNDDHDDDDGDDIAHVDGDDDDDDDDKSVISNVKAGVAAATANKVPTAAAATSSVKQAKQRGTGAPVTPNGKPVKDSSAAAATATAAAAPSQRERRDGTAREPVEQFDLGTRRTIRQFESQHAAAIATNVYQQDIYDCIYGLRDSAGDFGWRRPGSGGAAAATAATATRNGTTASRPRNTTGGIIPNRFQRSDPLNISFSKGTAN